MKRPFAVGLALFIFSLSASITSCSTFHSSSILGYEAVVTPIPEKRTPLQRSTGGIGLKVTTMGALLTNDKTNSLQGSLYTDATLLQAESVRVLLGAVVSGYAAITEVHDMPLSIGYQQYNGWGTTLQVQPRFVIDLPQRSISFSWNSIYNLESGDYRTFRSRFAETNGAVTRNDLSPHGSSLTTTFEVMNQSPIDASSSFGLGVGIGRCFPDWPYSFEGPPTGNASLIYTIDGFSLWSRFQSHYMSNQGLSLGFSTRLW